MLPAAFPAIDTKVMLSLFHDGLSSLKILLFHSSKFSRLKQRTGAFCQTDQHRCPLLQTLVTRQRHRDHRADNKGLREAPHRRPAPHRRTLNPHLANAPACGPGAIRTSVQRSCLLASSQLQPELQEHRPPRNLVITSKTYSREF